MIDYEPAVGVRGAPQRSCGFTAASLQERSPMDSDFLFAQPSVLAGIASIIDITGSFDQYNTTTLADELALRADWEIVGNDLRTAKDVVTAELSTTR